MDKNEFRRITAEWIEAHREEMAETLQAFCRIPSVCRRDLAQENAPYGPDCRKMLDFALETARKMGFETEDYEGHCGAAILGDGDNAIAIIAHLDVVPEGSDWRWPPYSSHREGDYIYGRGTSDNKFAAVTGLYLMKMFRELALPMKHGIKLLMGCAEETGMWDMKYYKEHYSLPVFILVPDGGFPVNYAQKGMLDAIASRPLGSELAYFKGGEVSNAVPNHAWALVTKRGIKIDKEDIVCEDDENGTIVSANGLAAHASRPETGKNAFRMLADALIEAGCLTGESLECMKAMSELAGSLDGEALGFAAEDPDTGKTTVNIGLASTKDGRVSVTLDSRVSLAMKPEQAEEAYRAYCAKNGWTLESSRVSDSMYIPKDDPKVQCLQALYKDMTGEEKEPYAMGGGTYARLFPNALTFGPGGSPAIRGHEPDWFKPGHGSAHAPDEYCYIPSMLELARIYASALSELDELV